MKTFGDVSLKDRLFFRTASLLTERMTARAELVERFFTHASAAAEREIGGRELTPSAFETIAEAIGFTAIEVVVRPVTEPSFGACRDLGTEIGINAVRKAVA